MRRRSMLAALLLLAACSGPTSPSPSSSSFAPSVTPGPTPTTTPAATPAPPRVVLGQVARIMVADLQVNDQPPQFASSQPVGVVGQGELVTVTEGPVVVAEQRWWKVEVAALVGWVPDLVSGQTALLDSAEPAARDWNVWAATISSTLPAAVANLPARLYVPNEADRTVTVVDVGTLSVIDRLPVGILPEHVTPDWDLSRLYVSNYGSTFMSAMDAQTGKLVDPIQAPFAYNLYFTPDGTTAIVMAEEVDRVDFYDRVTWAPLGQLPIPWRGIDHADFSAGGRYLMASTEYASGHVLKIDVVTRSIVGDLEVGGLPIDTKLSPDGLVFYNANQGRNGVSIIDPISMQELSFLPTGTGAHGMATSRDTKSLYVSNRLNGTISVISFATRQVVTTWLVGGTPDMLQVSPDGTQLWVSNRYGTTVSIIDTATGAVVNTIQVGRQPHGLTYFPQPGRFSIGHNGVYR
ncbi:MAG: beta-propeller fold lactonase family protein [Chloroflexota bacterium]